jgi:hypothetical protein
MKQMTLDVAGCGSTSCNGSTCRTREELERAVDHVFAHFGSQFKMEF